MLLIYSYQAKQQYAGVIKITLKNGDFFHKRMSLTTTKFARVKNTF